MTSTPTRPPAPAGPAAPRRPLPPLPVDPWPHVHAEQVGDGGWIFRPILPRTVTRTPGRGPRALSPRQVDVLVEVAGDGGTNAQIGAKLGIAENSVKAHLQRASRTLGAHDRAHAVILAMREGWIV